MTVVQRFMIGSGTAALGLACTLALPNPSDGQFQFPKFNQGGSVVATLQIIPGFGLSAGFGGFGGGKIGFNGGQAQ